MYGYMWFARIVENSLWSRVACASFFFLCPLGKDGSFGITVDGQSPQ
jgi:hypothetical protein